MNTKATRITDDLKWTALRYRFYTVQALEEAIREEVLLGMINDCATKLHEGNIKPVVDALRKNLSSQRTNMNKSSYVSPEAKDDWTRYDMLWSYTGDLMNAVKPTVANLPASTKAKARWQLTIEEMNEIPTDDYKALDSIYQNMASKMSKKPDAIEEIMTLEEYNARFEHISKLRSAARNLQSVAKAQVKVSDSIMAKLNKGGKATLSAAEVEELLKSFK